MTGNLENYRDAVIAAVDAYWKAAYNAWKPIAVGVREVIESVPLVAFKEEPVDMSGYLHVEGVGIPPVAFAPEPDQAEAMAARLYEAIMVSDLTQGRDVVSNVVADQCRQYAAAFYAPKAKGAE